MGERLATVLDNVAKWNGERAMAAYLSGYLPEYARLISNYKKVRKLLNAVRKQDGQA
jgi:hypothetical protein